MKIEVVEALSSIAADDWDRLVPANHPFLKHAFLQALEQHHCVGEAMGWVPRHLTLWDEGALVGAVPLYEKHNNYGEFVFDHAWADAYHRLGRRYYPKLVSAIPYTPVVGPRVLATDASLRPRLLQAAQQLAISLEMSGVHLLFGDRETTDLLQQAQWAIRHDCHFHWHNRGYESFDDFLQALKGKRRKQIRMERRRVAEAGVTIRALNGKTASPEDWAHFNRFYQKTFLDKGGMPTLNLGFFQQVAAAMPEQVLLFLADREGACIAGSLMFRSDHALYGRHWGCEEEVDFLHFEACYYQGIERAIEQGLSLFEPGAQGEHKIPRGFIPIETRSGHWLTDSFLSGPIQRFCEEERDFITNYREEKMARQPYRVPPG